MSDGDKGSYVIITPVRDEAEYVEKTLASVIGQTVRPVEWVIVDDGSQDQTYSVISKYASQYSWINLVKRERSGDRQPGSPIIHAFNHGLGLIQDQDFDFAVKLDCDLDLPSNYFEQLIQRFGQDPKLGIASGVYLEKSGAEWLAVPMPDYHAAGASKVMRRECFSDIGGFVAARGWDTLDEIRAQLKGWKTCHFKELHFRHLKVEGRGIGSLRTNVMHGEVYYSTGGGWLFLTLKVLHRMLTGKPFVLGGLAMLWGFLGCWTRRRPKLVTPEEAKFYRRTLNRRIAASLHRVFSRTNPKKEAWGQS